MTQIYLKQNIHKHRTQNFRRISPFGITPVEKAHKARTRWYRGPEIAEKVAELTVIKLLNDLNQRICL